jgi:hypothetical protein
MIYRSAIVILSVSCTNFFAKRIIKLISGVILTLFFGSAYAHPLEDDELYTYPLCGHEYVKEVPPWLGCPKVNKLYFYIEFKDETDRDSFRKKANQYFREIIDGLEKHSKRPGVIAVADSKKEVSGFAMVPGKDSVVLDVFVGDLEKSEIYFTVIGSKYYFSGSIYQPPSGEKIADLEGILKKLVAQYLVPSLYPDLKESLLVK